MDRGTSSREGQLMIGRSCRHRRRLRRPAVDARERQWLHRHDSARTGRSRRRLPGLHELLGIGDDKMLDLGGLIGAIIGVMILLGLYRAVLKDKQHPFAR